MIPKCAHKGCDQPALTGPDHSGKSKRVVIDQGGNSKGFVYLFNGRKQISNYCYYHHKKFVVDEEFKAEIEKRRNG